MKKLLTLLLFTSLIILLNACNTGPYSVTFVDYDDTVLKETSVEDGERANGPSIPFRFGYTFDSWDHDLDAIDDDVIIKAVYTPVTFETPLHELVYNGKYQPNITESSMVFVEGIKTQDKLYKRTDTAIYSMFQLTENNHRVDLYMAYEDDVYTGYELNQEDGCWMYTDINEGLYNNIAYTHSTRAMLPNTFDLDWFTKDDNTYILKRAHYDDIYEASNMTGAFLSYELTQLDDAFELYVEVFRNGETIEYLITFTDMGTTSIDFETFDTCTVN